MPAYYVFLDFCQEASKFVCDWLPLILGDSPFYLWYTLNFMEFKSVYCGYYLLVKHCFILWSCVEEIWTLFFLFKILFIYRGGAGGRKSKRNIDVQEIHWCVASHMPPTGDLAGNPCMCPDWESNWWPFGSQASTQSTEPHQPGLNPFLKHSLKNAFIFIIFDSYNYVIIFICILQVRKLRLRWWSN